MIVTLFLTDPPTSAAFSYAIWVDYLANGTGDRRALLGRTEAAVPTWFLRVYHPSLALNNPPHGIGLLPCSLQQRMRFLEFL